MKKDEDIFNIFREDQGKLDEIPSASAWNRLEKKLDSRKVRQRKIFYFQALAAASLALLITMVTTLTVFNTNNNNSAQTFEDTPNDMTLTATTDSDIGVRAFHEPLIMTHVEQLEYAENDSKLQKLRDNQIADGSYNANKKLLSKFDYKGDNNADSTLIAQALEKEEKPGTSFGDDKTIKESSSFKSIPKTETTAKGTTAKSTDESGVGRTIPASPKPLADNQPPKQPSDPEFDFDAVEPVQKPTISEDELETFDRKDLPSMKSKEQQAWTNESQGGVVDHSARLEKERIADLIEERKEDMILDADKKETGSKKSNVSSKTKMKSPALADKAERNQNREIVKDVEAAPPMAESSVPSPASNTIDIELGKNSISYEALDDKSNIQDIRLFEWLIGEWIDDDGQSGESWSLKNAMTIEGKGSFNVNGKTIFTERMEIRKIDDIVYFIVAVDSTNTKNFYRLNRYDGQQAIFENTALAFPNQVIIQKNSDDDFSTIMQNSAPGQISDPQQNFLLNRNRIANEKAYRNLKRSND